MNKLSKMINMCKYTLVMSLLTVSLGLQAQRIHVPWSCGFEQSEAAETALWQRVSGEAPDKWEVGRAVRSEGQQSMYISVNGGVSATYGATPDVAMAYRLLQFPDVGKTMEYDVSFDFSVQGTMTGTLYVYLDYESELISGGLNLLQYVGTAATTLPLAVRNRARYVYSSGYQRRQEMTDQKNWRSVSIDAGEGTGFSERVTKNGAQETYALVFVWVNKNTDGSTLSRGACVDNIQISAATVERPQNLRVVPECSDSSLTVQWEGGLDEYMVEYKRAGNTIWRKMSYSIPEGELEHSKVIGSLTDGSYDVRVFGRRWNEETLRYDTSSYSTLNGTLLYCPENQCINYINLETADCSYGPNNAIYGPFAVHKRVDYGSDDVLSFHTINKDQTAMDIRTQDKLRLVPEGSMTSVRLGNWYSPGTNDSRTDIPKPGTPEEKQTINGQAISYTFTVDTAEASLLMLQYALVLEESGHSKEDNTYFKLLILDENGELLDDLCGVQEFFSPAYEGQTPEQLEEIVQREHWHVYEKENFPVTGPEAKDLGFAGNRIWWKEWTSMGVILNAYQGHTLTVLIVSRGCSMSAHWGYGYFTIGCANATLETEQCGKVAESTVEAPDGFNYMWYAEEDRAQFESGDRRDKAAGGPIVSRDQSFTSPTSDDRSFICHMSYQDAPDCYLELRTSMMPREPKSFYDYEFIPENCEGMVVLTDRSRIARYRSDGTEIITDQLCDYSDWNIYSTRHPKDRKSYTGNTVTLPVMNDGDTLVVEQISYLGGGCSHDSVSTIIIPSLMTPDSVLVDSVCSNYKYQFDHEVINPRKIINRDTIVEHIYPNRFGCDSVLRLHLRIDSATVMEITDTVPRSALPLYFDVIRHGDTLRHYEINPPYDSLSTDFYVLKLMNRYDCDSMINLRLTTIPKLAVDIDSTGDLCGRTSVDFNYFISEGDFDSLKVSFSDAARAQGLRDTMIYHDPYNHPVALSQWDGVNFPLGSYVLPDEYEAYLTFYQHPRFYRPRTDTVSFSVRYPAEILTQKWNDVLTLYNAEHNGGYVFSSYQWYKDGQPIEGQTKSYLYVPNGLDLNGAEYTVALTRATDGRTQFSCPIVPEDRSELQVSPFPTIIRVGQFVPVRVASRVSLTLFDVMGRLVNSLTLSNQDGGLTAPSDPGWYILRMVLPDDIVTTQKVLVTL